MIDPQIRDQAYQFFIEEAPELLQAIETGLLGLKQDRSAARVHEIMRAAHSLKGGAASVGLEGIKTLAHRLEDFFKALYSEGVELDTELEGLLLEAYDCLKDPLTQQIATGKCDAEAALAAAAPTFSQIEARLGDSLEQADQYLPSSSDLGIDMVSSLFEVDVAQGLERLAQALANPQDYEVAGELRAEAEVFAGFAELLDLPGFGAIAQAALAALDRHPDRGLEITRLALADWQAARDRVLAGERARGGDPSPALLALGSGEATPPASLPEVPSLEEVFGTVAEVPPLEGLFEASPGEPETLAAAVEAVEEIFAELPPLEVPLPAAPAPAPEPPVKEKPAPEEYLEPNLSVRVDFNRLERLNNLVGELAINRNSLSLQNEQLQGSVRELLNRFSRFQDRVGKLREVSDRLAIASLNAGFKGLEPDSAEGGGRASAGVSFDALEMDSYGVLYPLLQELLEEMMQLEESVDDIVLFARGSNQTLEAQRQMLAGLRDELMRARMLPLGEVLQRFPRVLRDLSAKYGKPVQLKLSGTEVLVDKAALEKLYDPLLHLLRNAFDHGIEPPEVRQQQGKPAQGRIEIRAYHQGNQTFIEVTDDGRGFDLDKIGRTAVKVGAVTPEQLAVLAKEQLQDLIFQPGFSTASQVSDLSGRGVGLDVVRSQLRALKGMVAATSSPGRGTTFTLRLPLTLTISKLLVCLISPPSQSYTAAIALPSDGIEDIVIPKGGQVKTSGSHRFFYWQQEIVPIHSLAELLDYRCPFPSPFASQGFSSLPSPEDWGLPLLILRRGQQLHALEVSRLLTEQELAIKPFGTALAPPDYTYGCTVLGDGSLIPVINGTLLIERALNPETSARVSSSPPAAPPSPARLAASQTPTILVVDDSAALRRTVALTLEKAGYRPLQARDGREALEQLQQNPGIQLVICDVEMPNMNGFEFLSQRRLDPALARIPVAMLTSRSSDKHRQLALHLGADAYFTKPYIEQQFLVAVDRLISQSILTYSQGVDF